MNSFLFLRVCPIKGAERFETVKKNGGQFSPRKVLYGCHPLDIAEQYGYTDMLGESLPYYGHKKTTDFACGLRFLIGGFDASVMNIEY